MSSNTSPLIPLALAALTAVGVAVGIQRLGETGTLIGKDKPAAKAPVVATVQTRWAASASGRIEPKGGEYKLSALAPGRIERVLVKVNDVVRAGDVLVRIDDHDAMARVLAADAEAGVRKRERDSETNVPKLTQERRAAEDKLNNTQRAIALARIGLDRLLLERMENPNQVSAAQLDEQRKVLKEANKRLDDDREELRRAQLAVGAPLPTRLEAGLTAARTELSLAEEALERTRVRSPIDGTVLQVNARVGELASASPEQPLVVVGDLSALRARVEVEEHYVSKVSVGQEVVLKVDAFPAREFNGKVATITKAMRAPQQARKGPRRPNDLDVLEVMVDVEPGTPLLPGMRVDAFFRELPVAGAATSVMPSGSVGHASAADTPAAENDKQQPKILPSLVTKSN
ncbi:MAG: efflux RND transporter periplasmic adaptor subunit [Hyphomicrobiaceae bacterium]